MPTPGPVPWPRPEHTGAKHDIYRLYLERWFPILLSTNGYRSATYAEGFAGPGVYEGGEPGSPVIAVQALVDTPELVNSKKQTRFIFVDDDERCTTRLNDELTKNFPERPRPTDQMPVVIRKGTCAEALEEELTKAHAWDQPILAVLDSFGNVPVPHRLIERLANNRASEVIVTFTPQHFIRFVTDMGPDVDEVFGHDPAWRQVAKLTEGEAKRRFLLTQYRKMLQATGFRYLLDFEMVDPRGASLYLVFGTNHEQGLRKMKEAAWKVDPNFGVMFRDPRDEQNEALFVVDDPQDAPLRRLLVEELRGKDWVSVIQLRRFALFETVYREEHVLQALNRLRSSKTVEAQALGILKLNGKVRLIEGAK